MLLAFGLFFEKLIITFQFESTKLVLLIIIDLPTVLQWWNVLISGTCHLTKYKWPQFFSQLSTYPSFWPKVCYLSSIYCQNLSTPIFMFIFMWVKCNILLLKANAYISSIYRITYRGQTILQCAHILIGKIALLAWLFLLP